MLPWTRRRLIAGIALFAFLSGIAAPALAVARIAFDPAGFATVCRVDIVAGEQQPGTAHDRFPAAHCPLCLGHAAPPAADAMASVQIGAVPVLRVAALRGDPDAADAAALQPLHPRAPPRA
jgi:hypothetical protein